MCGMAGVNVGWVTTWCDDPPCRMPDSAFGNGECLVAGHERTSSSKPMITSSSFLRTLGRSALVALLVPAAAGAQAPMRGTTPPQAAGHRLGVPRAVAVERHVGR